MSGLNVPKLSGSRWNDRATMLATLASAVLILAACSTPIPALQPVETPRYIVYYDNDVSPLSAIKDTDYTHVILSFLRVRVDDDGKLVLVLPKAMDKQWGSVGGLRRNGKRVMVSFGGGLFTPSDYRHLIGREPELAAQVAALVRNRELDGVDIDFEATALLIEGRENGGLSAGQKFLIHFTNALRAELPGPTYAISHAPQPPYLDPSWHGGPYLPVFASVGNAIDWISVQYYNNRGFDGPAAEKIVGADRGTAWPTSIAGLISPNGGPGWPVEKIVVGKPIYRADAATGHLPPGDVVQQIVEPLRSRYGNRLGGLMGWQFSTKTADHRAWNSEIGPLLRPMETKDQ